MRRIFLFVVAVILSLTIAPMTASATETPNHMEAEQGMLGAYDLNLGDSDELYEQYLDELFYGGELQEGAAQSSHPKKLMRAKLTGQSKVVYDELKTGLAKIASGECESGIIEIPISKLGLSTTKRYTAKQLGLEYIYDYDNEEWNPDIGDAINALLKYDGELVLKYLSADCPYEMYWQYGRVYYTTGLEYTGSDRYLQIGQDTIAFYFEVENKYRKDATDAYSVDRNKTSTATEAVRNAEEIVSDAAELDDYSKLLSYKNAICERVSYNTEAWKDPSIEDRGAWALVYVFDEDPTTNVVCEGYSEAFQYLCKNTEFSSDLIDVYSVTGWMDIGPHKWNIVRMGDGKRYLVDITNCDEGTVGEGEGLFIRGVKGNVTDSYEICLDETSYHYSYDETTLSTFDEEELTLADHDFIYESDHEFGDWVTEQEASCEEQGVETRVCQRCGVIEKRVIPAPGHSEVVLPGTPATCTEDGLTEGKMCSVCEKTFVAQKTIPALGHDYELVETLEPATYLCEGKGSYVCRNDNSHTKTDVIPKLPQTTITASNVTASKTSFTYTGKTQRPTLTLKADGEVLPSETYTIEYPAASKNAGAYTAKITMNAIDQKYTGSVNVKYTIVKAKQPMVVKPKPVSVSYKKLKKKNQVVTAAKAFAVTQKQGTVTYKLTAKDKKAKSKIAVSSAGKITVKKGLKKGNYTIKVKATAKGNGNYKSGSKTVKVTIKIK